MHYSRKFLKCALCACLALVLMLGCLAGCSSTTESSTTTTEQTSTSETTTTSADGKIVVRERIGTAPTTLDPWAVESSGGDVIRQALYEKLLFKDIINQEYQNWLAESIEQQSETVYTVKIYDYITDTAGNNMTADDIVFSFEKAVAAGTVTTKVACLQEVVKVDDYTVEFHLNPNVAVDAFENCLAAVNCVTKAAWDASGDDMALNPIGTSNYKLKDCVSGSSWTFEKTGSYWQTDESKVCSCSQGAADEMIMSLISDTSSAAIALESGEVDVSMISATDIGNFLNEDGTPKDGYVSTTVPGLSVEMWFACCDEAPTSDINLRKAIAYCLDRSAIGYAMYGKNGPAMNSIVASNWMNGDYGQTADDYFAQDIELAKEYLAKSNYQGQTLRCMVVTPMANAGPLIQAYMAEIGVNCELVNYDRATFNSHVNDAAYGECDMIVQNVGSAGATPWIALGYLNGDGYEGSINRLYIQDSKLDEYYNSIKLVSEYNENSLKELNDYVQEQCYAVGLYTTNYYWVGKADLFTGFSFDASANVNPGACSYK